MQISFILGIFLLVAVGANIFQYKMHESYVLESSKTIAILKSANKVNVNTIATLEEQKIKDQNTLLKLTGQVKILEKEYEIVNGSLEKSKKRQRLALKKPATIERLANRATKRVFNDIYCSTGGECKDTKHTSSSSTTSISP